ncbi:MFS transporter [Streptomyces sp. NPDC048172]|uniref:MFS transporter n=1 Tax=Streptomyces sp. NPDC048172 TaxID=3365505 RepID=UPI003717437A
MTTAPPRRDDTDDRSRNRPFRFLLAGTVAVFGNLSLLLAVVPLWAEEGGGGHGGAGATTAVTMAATVAAQLCMGLVLRRTAARRALALGTLTMGLPAFAYALSDGLTWTLAVSAVRGLGFGMVTVAGSALVAELVPESRRGRAVGQYGVAIGIPAVASLPVGAWAADTFGYTPVFVVAGALGVLAAPLSASARGTLPPPERTREREQGRGRGRRGNDSLRPFLTPWTLLFVSVGTFGSLASFLPLALTAPGAAPAGLFALSTALIAGRWAAGVRNDRRGGAGRLAAPSGLLCALGMLGFGAAGAVPEPLSLPLALLAGAAHGFGLGALQNDTLVAMFHRAGPGRHGVASAVWNSAYDAGFGTGALTTGLLSQSLNLPLHATFLILTATLTLTATATLRRTSP